MSVLHGLFFSFSSLWIASGIVGYWELVTFLKDRPFFKQIPIWMWAFSECLFPVMAIELYSVRFGTQTISLYITYILVVSMISTRSDFIYPLTTWIATLVGFLGMTRFPVLFPPHASYALLFLLAGAVTPILNRLRHRMVFIPLYALILLSALIYMESVYADGILTISQNVIQWACTALPLFTYLFVQQHRGALLNQRYHDPLTNALNRRGYEAWIEVHRGITSAMFVVDLDDFKYMNDTFGHDAGDAVLMHVVQRMKTCLRTSDAIVRYGGDEFVCLVPDLTEEQVRETAIRLHEAIVGEPVMVRNVQLQVRASIGVAHGNVDKDLLFEADQRLLRAKRKGKNMICDRDEDELNSVHSGAEPVPLRWIADAMRALVESSPQGFVLTDEAHTIVEVNPAFESLCGYTRRVLIGAKPKILAARSSQNVAVYKQLKSELAERGFWKGSFHNERPNGEHWEAHETITAIRIGGSVVGYWAMVLEEADLPTSSSFLGQPRIKEEVFS